MSGEGYEGENSKREEDKRYGKRKATRRWTQKMRGRIEVTRASSSWRGSERTTLRSLYFCTTPFLFSPLSYPRLVVSHALYLDACRRVLAARACSRARASQKYVILLLYIYIYLCACIYAPTSRYLCPLTVMCGPSWNPSETRCFETLLSTPFIHSV